MEPSASTRKESVFSTLRRLAQPKGIERCEFCRAALSSAHRHWLEVATRKIICACDPCALRFENVIGRWKLIPRDARGLPDFQMTEAQWQELALPINLAFLFRSSLENRVIAMYPSTVGATESLLPIKNWEALLAANPCLEHMQPDVEALLVKRLGSQREYYLAPIDFCFELVGAIRLHWQGFSGGDRVWREIEHFFSRLKPVAASWSPAQQEAARA